MPIRIERIILREIRLPLVHFFETSFGRTTTRDIVLVEVVSNGVSGWGEVTAGENPFYNEEWTTSAWLIVRDYVAPRVLHRELTSAEEVASLTEHIRGHRMARGGVEAAVWDLEARLKGLPLWRHIGGGARQEIPCGVSIGIQDSMEQLLDKIACELEAGYQRIKIKIKPGWDVDVIARVRERFPAIKLMADANSAYTLADLPTLRQMERFYLMMIEQPLGWDDIYSHVELQKQLETPICLDECIFTEGQARAAVELGACRIINIKLGRVGGHAVARRMQEYCRSRNVPVWCGGMLESGIGRAHNIAMSTLPGFSLPGDVSASRRYWAEDIIEPEVEVTRDGTICVPTSPGIGYTPRRDRIEKLTVRKEALS